ncbi:LPS-assembly protein LptD [Emticicia aquatica]|uniref:LPS-assembly protein LptD n=1 Tax=Emticicia aquatica TaxID=1681835 RepID=A0ABM9AU87_9BACT|nr:OstA-like protein [Emticicia aquatica]CAH0997597.1 LPS-assembly protein LptD [Emticicia aquatica]
MNTKHLLGKLMGLVLIFISSLTFAQKPLNPPPPPPTGSRINLLSSDSLVGINQLPYYTRQFLGNVSFQHRGAILYCQSATQNETTNTLEAYGKIKIVQGDTLTITGDTLYYDGNTRFARVLGKKVVLTDKKVTLTTRVVEYDIQRNRAYYPVRGVIVQDSSILRSEKGFYNTRSKIFNYKENVEIVNPKYTITSDSLQYNARTKMALFKAPTLIKSKDGDIVANAGSTYNTQTQQSNFKGRSKIVNEDYTLTGDTLNFDQKTESGFAKGNVELVSKKDKVILTGKVGVRDGKTGFTKILGNALMRNTAERDTLYLSADTLYAYERKDSLVAKTDTLKKSQASQSTAAKMEKLIAFGHVKVYRSDMQSRCDSLLYDLKDSVIHFFTKPIIWSVQNQSEADTIHVYMKNSRVSRMYMINQGFVIAKDTAQNFNQIKGRKITAFFNTETRIEQVVVEGNGESIYYALDDKNKLIGVNRVECSKMNMRFKENQVNRISFLGKPDAKLVPPTELTNDTNRLEGFNWRLKEKPTKEEVLGVKFASKTEGK